jgi:integrase
VDLERGLAHVQRTRTMKRVGPTKTGRTRLASFLHPVCEGVAAWEPGSTPESRSVLAALLGLTVASLDQAGPLFSVAGRPIDEDTLYGLWRRTLTKGAIRYREPEQLRHTWASTMLSRNAPIVYVANQGGWKNPGVLLKHYAKWMPQVGPARAGRPATQAQPGDADVL